MQVIVIITPGEGLTSSGQYKQIQILQYKTIEGINQRGKYDKMFFITGFGGIESYAFSQGQVSVNGLIKYRPHL